MDGLDYVLKWTAEGERDRVDRCIADDVELLEVAVVLPAALTQCRSQSLGFGPEGVGVGVDVGGIRRHGGHEEVDPEGGRARGHAPR